MKKLVSDCLGCIHCGSEEDPHHGSIVIKLSEKDDVSVETEGLTLEQIRFALGQAIHHGFNLKP